MQANNLKLCVTAGVGSDHIDLNCAVEKHVQVMEVSGSNVVSVAEHVVMSILLLARNFVPAHEVQCIGCVMIGAYLTPITDDRARRLASF